MAVLIFRYLTSFALHEREMIPKLQEGRGEEEWEKNRIGKKENQTTAWGQQYELGRRRHPPSVSHTAVPQLVMLWLGQRAGSSWDCSKVRAVTNWCACSPGISVETCPQEQQGGRKASRGKKADGDGVGDRRLNFVLWLVGMRRHQEKEKLTQIQWEKSGGIWKLLGHEKDQRLKLGDGIVHTGLPLYARNLCGLTLVLANLWKCFMPVRV